MAATMHHTRLTRPFCLLLLVALAGLHRGAQAQGFDCAQATTVAEHRVCAQPALAQADADLNYLYSALLRKPTRPASLRSEQRRWLRQVRDRCADEACLSAAYQQRLNALQALNARPLDLQNARFEPLSTHPINAIDDTWVVRGLRLRAEKPTRLQLELHVNPQDNLRWRLPGPLVRVHCSDPDKREGYAGLFSFMAQAHGVEFQPVRRAGVQGFVLLPLDIGRGDLPLRQDIVCSVVFSEWLLDRPSTLYLVARP